jgi:hypothetical protein
MDRDYVLARSLYEESIELNRRLGDERMVAGELHNLAYVELHDDRPARAKELFAQALVEALGYDGLLPCHGGDAAVLAAEEGNAEKAAQLAGAAHAAFVAAEQIPDPMMRPGRIGSSQGWSVRSQTSAPRRVRRWWSAPRR